MSIVFLLIYVLSFLSIIFSCGIVYTSRQFINVLSPTFRNFNGSLTNWIGFVTRSFVQEFEEKFVDSLEVFV